MCLRFISAVLLLLGVLVGNRASAAPSEAAFVAATYDCTAPCSIFFDARATRDRDRPGYRARTELVYSWDFGDPDSGVWQHGVAKQSRNWDTGFVAAHVYERAGTYRVTLTVRDGEEQATAQTSVRIRDPNETFAGRRTSCFAARALPNVFEGCPDGAAKVIQPDLTKALGVCDTGKDARCLFRGGDTFSISETHRFKGNSQRLVGSFGKDPVEVVYGKPRPAFSAAWHTPTANVTICDMVFQGKAREGERIFDAADQHLRNFLFLRLESHDVDSPFLLSHPSGRPSAVPGEGNYSDRLALVDVKVASVPEGSTGNDVYVEATRLALLGCQLGGKGSNGHVIRFRYHDGTVLAHGNYGRHCSSHGNVIKMTNRHHDLGKGCGTNPARDVVIADNFIEACRDNDWVVSLSPNSSRWFETLETIVVERNVFDYGANKKPSLRMLQLRGPRLVARNNLFLMSPPRARSATAMNVGIRAPGGCTSSCGDCPAAHPMDDRTRPVDVAVYNNTVYSLTPDLTRARALSMTEYAGRTRAANNLMVAPNSRSVTAIEDDSKDARYCEGKGPADSCNLSFGRGGRQPLLKSRPERLADFAANAVVTVNRAVPAPGVYYDLLGRPPGDKLRVVPGALWSPLSSKEPHAEAPAPEPGPLDAMKATLGVGCSLAAATGPSGYGALVMILVAIGLFWRHQLRFRRKSDPC